METAGKTFLNIEIYKSWTSDFISIQNKLSNSLGNLKTSFISWHALNNIKDNSRKVE